MSPREYNNNVRHRVAGNWPEPVTSQDFVFYIVFDSLFVLARFSDWNTSLPVRIARAYGYTFAHLFLFLPVMATDFCCIGRKEAGVGG